MDFILWLAARRLQRKGNASFSPVTGKSKRWKQWVAQILSLRTCLRCRNKHGTIYSWEKKVQTHPLLHPHCKCDIVPMTTILAGSATKDGIRGADFVVKQTGDLPGSYLTKPEARSRGWKQNRGNLWKVSPGKIIGGDIFRNDKGKLPSKQGRIWYEADINYLGGYRGDDRILFSNDGLVFASYDHYYSFYEII